MRRSLSLPSAGRKKYSGGNKQEEQKASLAKVLAPYQDSQTGEDLASGGYKLGQHIAAGADGEVFRALALKAKKEVAVKRIRISSATIQRHAHQEVSAVFHARKKYAEDVEDLNCAGHPCIVGYLDWFAGPGGMDREVYIVMELCNFSVADLVHTGNVMRTEYEKMAKSHMSLEQLSVASKGKPGAANSLDPKLYRFPERELLKVFFQMLSALAFLNRHGIFHRDVKSENILWKHNHPNKGCYKLADFGVAFCEAHSEPSKRHDHCGTLWTMAPELLGKKPVAGPSCDTWSLAVVLFEIAFYERPFNSMELLSFRNGTESLSGFWNCLCGETKCLVSSSPTARRWGPGSPSNPSSPKNATMSGGFGGGTPKHRRTSSASVTSLPCVSKPGFGAFSESLSAPTSPVGRLSKALAKRKDEINSSAASPLPRRGTGMEEDTMTPATPANGSSSPSDYLRARKRAFLRKRSSLKWIYNEDLRIIIFEDMLDEDANLRPTAADLIGCAKLQALFSSHDFNRWSSAQDVARAKSCSLAKEPTVEPETPTAADERPTSASGRGSGSAEVAAPVDGSTSVLVGNALRRLTPEAFLAVLKVHRKFDAAVYSQQNYNDSMIESESVTTAPNLH